MQPTLFMKPEAFLKGTI